jgi:hypothetical protein
MGHEGSGGIADCQLPIADYSFSRAVQFGNRQSAIGNTENFCETFSSESHNSCSVHFDKASKV